MFETVGAGGLKLLKQCWMLGVQFKNLHMELIDECMLWPELPLDLQPLPGVQFHL